MSMKGHYHRISKKLGLISGNVVYLRELSFCLVTWRPGRGSIGCSWIVSALPPQEIL
jgi:hypothetical protein